LVVAALLLAVPTAEAGKGYSSGSRSYSSSRSSSSGSSRSSGSGFGGGGSSRSSSSGSSSSGGSSKSFSSGNGSSYSSGGSSKSSYSSGRSYTGSSGPGSGGSSGSTTYSSSGSGYSRSKSSGMNLDNAAARASKEQASKDNFNSYKRSQNPGMNTAGNNNGGGVPPVINRGTTPTPSPASGSYSRGGGSTVYNHTTVYVDHTIYSTRPYRFRTFYEPYYSRPIIVYHDHYNSFFWWWLLDRSIEDQAYWAYHHRLDMDAARYQALLDSNAQLASRVHQLETNQTPRDPNYVPQGIEPDLMYNDQTIKRAYAAQPTRSNQTAFWVFMVPTTIGLSGFMIWLIFYKRWQTV